MGNSEIRQCFFDLKPLLKFIISIFYRMWTDLEGGKIMRRQVRDEKGRLVGKIFRVEEIVGQGEDWKVATVIDEDTMERCTLKMLTKSDNICKTQIINEIKNQKKMAGRPNFVDLKAVYEDANLIYLLMELWGIPLEKILTRRRALMEREVQLIFCQLIDILENLRSANVSHGNIALTTVLLATDQENFIQLTDFTHSHDLSTDGLGSDKNSYKGGSDHQSKTKWNLDNALSNEQIEEDGSMLKSGNKEINEYTSPEQYYDDRNSAKISYERDIWACGVLLYKLLTGMYPFTGEGGKLILNKIKYATFSFPTLEDAKCSIEQEIDSHFKGKSHLQFLSRQWKELLKRMLSVKNQRITLKELINHPFKLAYFELKNIPSLNNSHPDLNLLFSTKTVKQESLFKKSWNINYEQEEQEEMDESDDTSEINLGKVAFKKKNNESYQSFQKISNNENKSISRDSLRGGTFFQKYKEADNNFVQVKNFRMHKTQFGFCGDSVKSTDNQRHETLGGVMKDKLRKQKEFSLFTPFSGQSDIAKIPELVKEPPFIIKFKFFKRNNYLGYILNNSVGVVFEDGDHIIGHTKDKYRYVEEPPEQNSQILIDNPDCLNNLSKAMKQSIYKSQSKNMVNQRNTKDDSVKLASKIKANFMSEQVSSKNIDQNVATKYTTSNVIDNKYFKSDFLSREKLNIYLKALDHFGERVVKGPPSDIWIEKFWRNGNIFIFLLSTGCWQVAFCEVKGFRMYAIDQYDLSWSKDLASSDVLHSVREIVRIYKQKTNSKKQEKA